MCEIDPDILEYTRILENLGILDCDFSELDLNFRLRFFEICRGFSYFKLGQPTEDRVVV